MSAVQFYLPYDIAIKPTNVGAPGAKLYVYAPSTTAKRAVYATSALTTQLANPVTADGAGKFPPIYLDNAFTYKIVINDKNGAPLYQRDPYIPGMAPDSAALAPYQSAAEAAAASVGTDAVTASTAAGTASAAAIAAQAYLASLTALPTQGLGLTAASRVALALLATTTPAILTESGREGVFVWSSSNHSADVTNDPSQGIYVPRSSDATGATGSWVRKFDGPYHAKWWGVVADNLTDNHLTAQAAINAVSAFGGGELHFPAGITKHSGLIFKNKIQYRGAGRDTASTTGTILLYTGTGDGVVISNPINSSTSANVSVEGITFKNATVNAGKGCFADTGSTDLKFRQCAFVGSDRGLILDQSELTDVIGCDFEAVTSQTSLIWIVSGPDRNLGASQGFSNRISIQQCQIDGNATTIGIVDDGGAVHNFADNNYNGCLNHIRAAGVGGLSIRGGEFEGAAGSCVNLYSTTLAGAVSGACSPVLFDNSIMSPTASQHCITCFAAGQITLVGPFFGSTTATKLNGTGNISSVIALGVHNGGGGANFDGFATNHFEVDHSAAAISTNMPLQSTAAVGYVAGAGGTATQATSKSTGVPLNKLSGEITMNAAALAAGAIVSFTLTNSQIAAGDRIILNHVSGGTLGAYALNASAGAGSAAIHVRNATAGSLSEAIVIGFAVLKATNA
jgi:hypothetical protein